MGLDICVRKIVKRPKDKDYYFRLIDNNGNYENNFPEWTKAFENEVVENCYDWNKYKEQTGIDINECSWHGESYGEEGCFMKLWPNSGVKYPEIEDYKIGEDKYDWERYRTDIAEHMIQVDLEKVPTYQKTIKVLYYEETGYQRKGLNSKFYEDYEAEKIGYFVWTKEELERYKQEYCYEDYKDYFQKNIIDNFVEGEDCVIFDW